MSYHISLYDKVENLHIGTRHGQIAELWRRFPDAKKICFTLKFFLVANKPKCHPNLAQQLDRTKKWNFGTPYVTYMEVRVSEMRTWSRRYCILILEIRTTTPLTGPSWPPPIIVMLYERYIVSNRWQLARLFNRLFRPTPKEHQISTLHICFERAIIRKAFSCHDAIVFAGRSLHDS